MYEIWVLDTVFFVEVSPWGVNPNKVEELIREILNHVVSERNWFHTLIEEIPEGS